MARQEKKRRGEVELDNTEASVTALDVEDTWRKTAEGFQPAERGPGDAAGLQSVKRKPDLPLRLAVHYRLGSEEVWDLPWAKHSAGETLRCSGQGWSNTRYLTCSGAGRRQSEQ